MSRIPKDAIREPFIKNGGNGALEPASEKELMEEGDRAILMAKTVEIEEDRKKLAKSQRDIAFISVDLYEKSDELEVKIKEWGEKYKLKKGSRELDLRSGEIVNRSAQA